MKTAKDPRHQARAKAIQSLFSYSFRPKKSSFDNLTSQVIPHLGRVDKLIVAAAPEWPIQQINHIDLAILRLAVFELTIAAKEPVKVIIDEAVELAKAYGGENSPQFINGVLGTILKKIND